jgi:hypothetical protein
MFMKKIALLIILLALPALIISCPGIGKKDKEAADKALTEINSKYSKEIVEIKIWRDKLEVAFPKGIHPMTKSQVFQECAAIWWMAYPEGKKPSYRLYCFAYDDKIGTEDIGSLQITKGISDSQPKITGQPGIYILRDIK